MARQHALCGVLAGVGIAACVPSAPWAWRCLVVVVTGGAALLPDLDHPGATAARSLGWVTRLLARLIDAVSLAVYHATRLPHDPAERRSGHRLLTHTIPGCLAASSVAAVLCLIHPAGGSLICLLLGGLLGLGMRLGGCLIAASTAASSAYLMWQENTWWWLVPVAVFVGCLVHIGGDAMTNSGVPLLWPYPRQGQRWHLVRLPVTFSAGDEVERLIVAPCLYCLLMIASTGVLGVWPLLWQLASGGAS